VSGARNEQSERAGDARLGDAASRRARAAVLLEEALAAHPEALSAIGLLASVQADGSRDRLIAVLRSAFERARSPEAIILLGGEIARVACGKNAPPDLVLAIDALRRVLVVVPAHVPTLRAIAGLYAAQGAWAEAASALESVASHAREPQVKLAALAELARISRGPLAKPEAAERALRRGARGRSDERGRAPRSRGDEARGGRAGRRGHRAPHAALRCRD
jgi:hypothetical protein